MIALEGIRLTQGGFTLDLSLSVSEGARLAVLGASGSGKSTLLNVIAGFARPDAGRVLIGGAEMTDAPVAARPVDILFQDGNLFPHLSAFDNVALGLRTDLRLSRAEREKVEEALARVGLDDYGDRRPGSLSGGQQSRVALARMLLRDRPVALLDEPFAALDPALRAEMAALLGELAEARGLTLVMVTHDLRGWETLATDLCLLEEGRIALSGPSDALRQDPPERLRPWL